LPSDASFRPDLINLAKGDIETAQIKKEELEVKQRYDAKLRSEAKKLKEGPPKKKGWFS